jgi:biopolymer transport protein ExbD
MQFRRRLKPNVNVDLVPMIDVVFQLVVFFMVSSTFILTPGISLSLPESSSSEPVVMTKLVVSIIGEDEIYLNKEKYSLDGLHAALSEMDDESLDGIKTVVLEGDRRVSYEVLVNVLDILRKHGFKGVNLKTMEAVP